VDGAIEWWHVLELIDLDSALGFPQSRTCAKDGDKLAEEEGMPGASVSDFAGH